MINKILKFAVVLVSVQLITACSGSLRDGLGLRKDAPDEFKVISSAPLNVPPSFYLRPPSDKAEIKSTESHASEAKNILFSDKRIASHKNLSSGEKGLLVLTGYQAKADIRELIKQDNTPVIEEKKTNKLLQEIGFYKSEKDATSVVHAKKERERIIENKKNGESVITGETPTVQKNEGGIFNKIFGL